MFCVLFLHTTFSNTLMTKGVIDLLTFYMKGRVVCLVLSNHELRIRSKENDKKGKFC